MGLLIFKLYEKRGGCQRILDIAVGSETGPHNARAKRCFINMRRSQTVPTSEEAKFWQEKDSRDQKESLTFTDAFVRNFNPSCTTCICQT
jgi:hypothetical protein